MKKILTALFILAFSFLNAQTYKYEFKLEGINSQAEAKMVFDDIRFFFNTKEEPFKYVLTFNEDSYFVITTSFDKDDEYLNTYFESKNMVLIKYNKYYYE